MDIDKDGYYLVAAEYDLRVAQQKARYDLEIQEKINKLQFAPYTPWKERYKAHDLVSKAFWEKKIPEFDAFKKTLGERLFQDMGGSKQEALKRMQDQDLERKRAQERERILGPQKVQLEQKRAKAPEVKDKTADSRQVGEATNLIVLRNKMRAQFNNQQEARTPTHQKGPRRSLN